MQFKTRKDGKLIYTNIDTAQRKYTPVNRVLGAITGNESFNTATLRFSYPGKWCQKNKSKLKQVSHYKEQETYH